MSLKPLVWFAALLSTLALAKAAPELQVPTASGVVEGKQEGDLRVFLGIPYAEPPVGPLRWKPPVPHARWEDVRPAKEFGHRASQGVYYDDMFFRDAGGSEDCLTLNVWTPAHKAGAGLPVMVWIHGGGHQAGGSSEPRQDGAVLAREGVVVVSMNYRMGVFGFLVHPALIAESPVHAAGNYGLLDQLESLKWVRDNIAAFGGDPKNVTIFGESAGSFSVSALMGAPAAKGLFQRAIGESGAMFEKTAQARQTLAQRAAEDAKVLKDKFGAETAEQLRAISGEALTEAFSKPEHKGGHGFRATVDGLFLSKNLNDIFAAGEQHDVPVLAGWNHDEGHVATATPAALKTFAEKSFGPLAPECLRVYAATTDAEAARAMSDLQGDSFIGWSTWRWLEAQVKTGKQPVYRFRFDQDRPVLPGQPERGAYHSAEIVYVFGVLDSEQGTPWKKEHYELSALMRKYWANFARTGNPNQAGLPEWPLYTEAAKWPVLHLDTKTEAKADALRERYLFLSKAWEK